MPAKVYPVELMERGRELPSQTSLPTDEELTAAVLAAGFSACHGRPYSAARNPNVERSTSVAKAELGAWPRGRPGR